MHDYDMSDYLYAAIADLDAAVRYSVELIREQYAGHQWPDYVSPAVAKASRALAASEKLLSENNDPRLVDGFSIVFGPGYEHSK